MRLKPVRFPLEQLGGLHGARPRSAGPRRPCRRGRIATISRRSTTSTFLPHACSRVHGPATTLETAFSSAICGRRYARRPVSATTLRTTLLSSPGRRIRRSAPFSRPAAAQDAQTSKPQRGLRAGHSARQRGLPQRSQPDRHFDHLVFSGIARVQVEDLVHSRAFLSGRWHQNVRSA